MDLTKVNDLLSETNKLAQLQQQANVASSAPAAPPANSSVTPANSQLFAKLGAVLAGANAQPTATSSPVLKQAAVVSSKTKALMAKADTLEEMLNLSPTPDYVGAETLIGDFQEILGNLEKEMGALRQQLREQEKANEMKMEQKPTALRAGENPNAPSFNNSLSVV
jgi:hypothetical protein